MPFWEVIPKFLDGDVIGDDQITPLLTSDGYQIGYAAGWIVDLSAETE